MEGTSSASFLISTENLAVGYSSHDLLLTQVNLVIEPNQVILLTGGNGAGKTSLFKTLVGLLPVLGGHLQRKKNLKLAYVPQVKKIPVDYPLSVRDVLALHRREVFWKKSLFDSREWEILQTVELDGLLDLPIAECSGGQLQRVLLTRALLARAELVFLDEPMDALDQKTRKSFQSILAQFRTRDQTSFFIITHHPELVWQFGWDQFLFIENMRLVKKS